MGYDVHITRKADWSDSRGPVIALDEWKALVESDPEMRMDNYAEAPVDGDDEVFSIEEECIAVWTAYSRHGVRGNMAWFCYSDGEVIVKNPDEEIIGKMWRITQALGAKVQGDEDEVYDEEANLSEEEEEEVPSSKPWWKFW